MNRATGKRIVNSHAEVDACSVTFPRGDIQSGKLSQEPRLVDVRSLRGESVVGRTAKRTILDMRIDRYRSHLRTATYFWKIFSVISINSDI